MYFISSVLETPNQSYITASRECSFKTEVNLLICQAVNFLQHQSSSVDSYALGREG